MQSHSRFDPRSIKPPRGSISSQVCLVFAAPLFLNGCSGPQSWVDPAGADARIVADLLWIVLASALVIWFLVIGLTIYAGAVSPKEHSRKTSSKIILWGGIVAPTAAIFMLLLASLLILRETTGRTPDRTLHAQGEQWWWRIAHEGPDGALIQTPNELRLPANEVAEVVLTSNRVIHSFWVPVLGGKMDMIPGRENRLTFAPTEPGVYRGQCAEFCGTAHAQMAFPVVIMEPAEFERWLARQARPASEPRTEQAKSGRALFLSNGCGSCHTVRGTQAQGSIGPDLTHLGSRLSLGAHVLPVTRQNIAEWVRNPEHLKPGARMPAFDALPEDEIELIAAYLADLE